MSGFGFRYRLRLVDPVLLGGGASDPNAVSTLPYVPGSVMRGVAAASRGRFDAGTAESQRLLFRKGDAAGVRFLHAYPAPQSDWGEAVGGRQRVVPTPRSWEEERVPAGVEVPGEEDRVVEDRAVEPNADPAALYRPLAEPFVVQGRHGTAWPTAPERLSMVRSRWVREKRRADRDGGAVFLWGPLAPGQVLEGAVVASDEPLARAAWALLPEGSVFLGDEKGEAVLSHLGAVGPVGSDGLPAFPDDAGRRVDKEGLEAGRYGLVLRSDVVLRDEAGDLRPTAAAAARALEGALRVGVEVVAAHVAEGVAAGFNAHMGLPLRREPALAMGSVVVVDLADAVSGGSLARALARGLGERTAEGHGHFEMVRLERPTWALRSPTPRGPGAAPTIEAEADVDSWALAVHLVDEVVRRRLAAPVRQAARDQRGRFRALTPSQRGRLRTVLEAGRRAGGREGAQQVLTYLEGLTRRTRRQYDVADRGPSAGAWLADLFGPLTGEGATADGAPVWTAIGVGADGFDRVAVGGARAALGLDDVVGMTFDLALGALRRAPSPDDSPGR